MFFRKDKENQEKEEVKTSEEQYSGELKVLETRIIDSSLPEEVKKVLLKELEKIKYISTSSAEYTIGLNYINYVLELPWDIITQDNLDLKHAKEILDEDHYGLDDVKERILEFLAIRQLRSRKKVKILVVDDEKITCLNLKHVLEKEGYEVEYSLNGAEAIHKIDNNKYDLVITDLKMQDVDGFELLDYVKKKDKNIEVIIITGYATVSSAVSALKKGSYHFLSKPLELTEVRNTVKNALNKRMVRLDPRGPILCFVGPPGTGKTSLGLSIARSLGRKFVRISLAGVKDEAQIRGHRRSYVGALPGRIIQEIKNCGSKNPVFMLDELDKVSQDFKGDPSAPLLEVLDPEQNKAFVDHYLEIPFDLSKVMFIATANTLETIPGPLLDRLEVIHLSGYTQEEKLQIAKNYLIPKAVEKSALGDFELEFPEQGIRYLIAHYTKEAGLRGLQRQIDAVCRKLAKEFLLSDKRQARVDEQKIVELLGPPKYMPLVLDAQDRVGVSTALAWTPTGGEILFIEVSKMKGNNKLILTGSLGEVLKESAQAAVSFFKSRASEFGIPDSFFATHDLHIHVPAGAIAKDGPSAGLAIAVALYSLLLDVPCKRKIAMTGEITLTGRVLPVGGIKEKLLAASLAGVEKVILPEKNKGDLSEVSEDIKKDLEIILVRDLQEALKLVV
ncbi:MAG: ATP-dependent Lon protease [Desulfonauticus sp.]|jgi:ATP-dependent Lon protease|nr:MAG: Anti-sigma H sporulation factor, LonB [Desulfonauticus sp. 38_4375]MDK2922494.1 ATP-dependent Lon protease [Desulfonauticus sp.]